MPSNGSLGDYVSLQRGKTYKSRLLNTPGPYLLGLASIARNGGFRSDNLKTYGGDSPEALLLRPGDLYVSLKDVTQSGDLLGSIARVPDSIPLGRLTQDTVKLLLTDDAPPASYIYWLLRTPEYRGYCRGHATGTTNLGLSREDFLAFPVPALTIPRELIVASLDDIESKIEQNRRTVRALERLARAIFRAWFVDFEPVKAKAAGATSFPSMPQPIFDALPITFTDSELGPIPEGWTFCPATEIAAVAIGKTPPRKEPHWFSSDPSDVRWVSIKDMGQSGVFISDTSEYLTSAAIESHNVRRIPDGSVLFSFKLTVGRVTITDGEMTSNEAIAHFVPKDVNLVGSEFLYCYLSSFDCAKLGSTSSIATATNSKAVKSMPILVPDDEVVRSFTSECRPIFEMLRHLGRESRKLAELRDYLLPKLLSGQVRVRDAEAMAGEVG